jgi:hypothetical protein
MPNYIVKLGTKYLEWSTIVDAPITHGMTREELHDYIKSEYGEAGLRSLPERLERVEATGTSSRIGTLEGHIACNRAGPKETELTFDELVAWANRDPDEEPA